MVTRSDLHTILLLHETFRNTRLRWGGEYSTGYWLTRGEPQVPYAKIMGCASLYRAGSLALRGSYDRDGDAVEAATKEESTHHQCYRFGMSIIMMPSVLVGDVDEAYQSVWIDGQSVVFSKTIHFSSWDKSLAHQAYHSIVCHLVCHLETILSCGEIHAPGRRGFWWTFRPRGSRKSLSELRLASEQ